ncbi:GPP34 family phosphoprotein [Streptomyces sp. Li-HN-5-11]|uniref:GOLPH3/VPS74 family protein n=1 Tax=Streptomyces sp. Li-HN-5-11 TaxID=3075432 RepID=UPI0028AF6F0E|nr:GPP34 family phosphoprotein [Streptomyces sp. Li-HN-5-11]WNM31996.1 GPP34 family phosphoprotein [Streptomyces sp. Li-HN-5-11]WOP39231.1 GPP34 family phosphoprotein [Streptomyces sp. Li-HN-5-13]
MSTPRDLMIVALDVAPSRPLERGDLSLALAGAEAYDLLRAEALTLDGERIVPRRKPDLEDRLLDEAAGSLVRQMPYESLADWLWRRGRGLASVYLAALEDEGQVTWERSRWLPFRSGRTVLSDTGARRRAAYRWAADEPVLLALAAAVGIREEIAGAEPGVGDDAVLTVLAAVHDAVMELEAVRQRRAIEEAAFANVWRGA